MASHNAVLVTGAAGFTDGHLTRHLTCASAAIWGARWSVPGATSDELGCDSPAQAGIQLKAGDDTDGWRRTPNQLLVRYPWSKYQVAVRARPSSRSILGA